MRYLARLKAKIAEMPLQCELTKLPKVASVSFGSSQGEGLCRNVAAESAMPEAPWDMIEERRAIIAGCCPAPYANVFARLNHQMPHAVNHAKRQRCGAMRSAECTGPAAVRLMATLTP